MWPSSISDSLAVYTFRMVGSQPWLYCISGFNNSRTVGQIRICTPYMTVYLMWFLPRIRYIHGAGQPYKYDMTHVHICMLLQMRPPPRMCTCLCVCVCVCARVFEC
jgi:hypothetical protein